MTSNRTTPAFAGGATLWSGCALSGLAVAFLALDGVMKLVPLSVVTETMPQRGWSADMATARLL